MQLHELACSYMSLHAVPQACMQLQELACSYKSLHAVPFFVWEAHKNFAVLVKCKKIRHSYKSNWICSWRPLLKYFGLYVNFGSAFHSLILETHQVGYSRPKELFHRCNDPWMLQSCIDTIFDREKLYLLSSVILTKDCPSGQNIVHWQ